jgi:hypothetical protein
MTTISEHNQDRSLMRSILLPLAPTVMHPDRHPILTNNQSEAADAQILMTAPKTHSSQTEIHVKTPSTQQNHRKICPDTNTEVEAGLKRNRRRSDDVRTQNSCLQRKEERLSKPSEMTCIPRYNKNMLDQLKTRPNILEMK